MSKLALLLSCLNMVVLGAVGYYFENSNLVVTGLEKYEQVEVIFADSNIVLPANSIRIPWAKGRTEEITIVPIVKDLRENPIILKIDGKRNLPPTFRMKMPTYLPAGRVQLEYSLTDDWDLEEKITKKAFIDGKAADVFRDGYVEIDTFFLHSGEHRLRVVLIDTAGRVTDQTYRFTVIPHLPSPPQVKAGRVLSEREHRIYTLKNSGPLVITSKGDVSIRENFCFVTDMDGAGNESSAVLHYSLPSLTPLESSNVISLTSSELKAKEYTIFGRVVLPNKDVLVLRSGASLKIPAGCSLMIRGILVAEPGSSIHGQGQLIIADEARVALLGANVGVDILVNGSSMMWLSDAKINSKLTVSRSLFVAFHNVNLKELSVSNVRKLWFNYSSVEDISLSGVAAFLISNSKITQRLQVSDFSSGRVYNSNLYSTDLPLVVSNFSMLEMIDSWVSGKRCALVQDFSVLRARSTQFNGDNSVLVSGFSVLDGFAISITSATAITLRDSRARLLKAEISGQVLKVGRSEMINLQ